MINDKWLMGIQHLHGDVQVAVHVDGEGAFVDIVPLAAQADNDGIS